MEKQEALNKINTHRAEIDALDREIVELLNKRAELSIAIRRLKPAAGMQLLDTSREDAIYEKICVASSGELYDTGLMEIYATLLKVMKENPDREAKN